MKDHERSYEGVPLVRTGPDGSKTYTPAPGQPLGFDGWWRVVAGCGIVCAWIWGSWRLGFLLMDLADWWLA